MYTVLELTKLTGVSKKTLYEKLKHPDLSQFITQGEKGKLLQQEGLEVLLFILGNSKAGDSKRQVNSVINSKIEGENSSLDSVYLGHIETLKETIRKLDLQILRIEQEKAELQKKYDDMVNFFMQLQQQKLLETTESREVKRSFWDIFRKK